MKVFSEEWFGVLVEKLKGDAEFQEKGEGFDSSIHFKVLKDPKAGADRDIVFGMWLPTAEPSWYGPKPEGEVDIILEAKGGTFQEVFTGKKNIVIALTMGLLKLKKGSVTKLTGNLGAVNRFMEIVQSVS